MCSVFKSQKIPHPGGRTTLTICFLAFPIFTPRSSKTFLRSSLGWGRKEGETREWPIPMKNNVNKNWITPQRVPVYRLTVIWGDTYPIKVIPFVNEEVHWGSWATPGHRGVRGSEEIKYTFTFSISLHPVSINESTYKKNQAWLIQKPRVRWRNQRQTLHWNKQTLTTFGLNHHVFQAVRTTGVVSCVVACFVRGGMAPSVQGVRLRSLILNMMIETN